MKVQYNTGKDFIYFPFDDKLDGTQRKEDEDEQNLSNETLDELLKTVGREVLKERTPALEELESTLQEIWKKNKFKDNIF